jgi:hypothetical protein
MDSRIGEPETLHKFKNCLALTLSYCDLLLDELPPDSPMRSDVSEIQAAIRTAATLLPCVLEEATHPPSQG